MRRFSWIALAVFLFGVAARAEAMTVKDIIDLTRAGLGEEALIALVEVDGSVFSIDKETLMSLKTAGVSDRVIEAMIRSGRMPQNVVPAPAPTIQTVPQAVPAVVAAPEPQVIVIEHETPIVQQVAVPVPVFVPVASRRVRGHRQVAVQHVQSVTDLSAGLGVPAVGISVHPDPAPRPAKQVYWGWGGKLRPDAWKPR
jgi:hypothetical protein